MNEIVEKTKAIFTAQSKSNLLVFVFAMIFSNNMYINH